MCRGSARRRLRPDASKIDRLSPGAVRSTVPRTPGGSCSVMHSVPSRRSGPGQTVTLVSVSYSNVSVTAALLQAYVLSDMYERLALRTGTAVGHMPSLAYAYEVVALYHLGAGHWKQAETQKKAADDAVFCLEAQG